MCLGILSAANCFNLKVGKKMDKKIVFFLSFCALLASCNMPADNFKLRDGDLLFSVGKGESELLKAIQNATSKDGEIPFSHVGIACIENDSVFVLEAAQNKGVKTPLADFIDESAKIDSKPIVAVGRMKKSTKNQPKRLQRALMHLGKNMILHTANQTMIFIAANWYVFFPGQQWKTDFPGTAHVIQKQRNQT